MCAHSLGANMVSYGLATRRPPPLRYCRRGSRRFASQYRAPRSCFMTSPAGSTILEAAGEFPEMQMVLSVGTNVDPSDLGPIAANTIVVRSAPQIELLKRAALCLTHAGLNTTL